MATIRERVWVGRDGKDRRRWQADFIDQQGRRRHKQFTNRKTAGQFLVRALGQVETGVYSAESSSPRLNTALQQWLERAKAEKLERATLAVYRQLARHIQALMPDNPKLSRITQARSEQLRDDALKANSRTMARDILRAFKSVLKDAKRRGQIAANPASETTIGTAGRHKKKLRAGVDFPLPAELSAMLTAAGPKAKAAMALAGLAGHRVGELRGMTWANVDLGARASVTIVQRADRWSTIGSPKSEAGQRTVPLGQIAAQALREWRLAQPGGRSLMFGTSSDRPDMRGNLQARLLTPLCAAAGVPTYSWHKLRHYAVSSWLASGIDIKTAQTWAGHASAIMTANVYGHFIPRADDHSRIDAAEQALLGIATKRN
jgi:integrase